MQTAFDFDQGVLDRPKFPERLFFGVFPDVETSAHVYRFGQRFICKNHLSESPLKQERLHVSLHHVGDYKRLRTKFVFAASLAGKAVSMRPFEVTFRFIASFAGAPAKKDGSTKRPLVLLGESEALFELHERLGAAIENNGLRAAEEFMPHLTLSYGQQPILAEEVEPIRFVVKEFALIHSKLWLTQYDVLRRWSLCA